MDWEIKHSFKWHRRRFCSLATLQTPPTVIVAKLMTDIQGLSARRTLITQNLFPMKKPKNKYINSKNHEKCFACDNNCKKTRKYMQDIFKVQLKLARIAPAFGWKGLGNVLGDYGEYMAMRHYGIKKSPNVAKGHDGVLGDDEHVQIKTCLHLESVSYRTPPQNLLVFRVKEDGRIEEVYAGPFSHIATRLADPDCDMKPDPSETDKKLRLKVTDLIAMNIHEMPRQPCAWDDTFLPNPTPPAKLDKGNVIKDDSAADLSPYECSETSLRLGACQATQLLPDSLLRAI